MRLALVLHPTRKAAASIAAGVVAAAAERGMEVTVTAADHDRVPSAIARDPVRPVEADFIVAVGGDGTVLQAAGLALQAGLPIVGINAGNVGFLAEIEPPGVGAALDALVAGEYRISERMTVRVRLPDGSTESGLNDVVIEKVMSQHVVALAVGIEGRQVAQYRADAVIVASPTGSTAYSYSAGGPLVDPEMEALVMTAVAPHNLFGRAIVFDASTELEIVVSSDRPARVNVDGRDRAALSPGDTIVVGKGPQPVRLVKLSPGNFALAVKEEFHLHDA